MNGSPRRRYILLPKEGTIATKGPAFEMLTRLPPVRSTSDSVLAPLDAAPGRDIRIVDTIDQNGPRLVEADPETVDVVNSPASPLRLQPVVEYRPPNPPLHPVAAGVRPAATAVTITCTDAMTGQGVAEALVVAFTDFTTKVGGEGMTDATGSVTIQLASDSVERLYVYPPLAGYWGAYRSALDITGPMTVPLNPIDLHDIDVIRHYYGGSDFDDSRNIEVGVIDTGVGPHGDLSLVGGTNTVTGENRSEYGDPRGHGTHVAGLIGSNGTPPTGLRGVAPGVRLRAYRVFPDGDGGATNYAILKAMIFAANDGCDIVNLSLGGGPHDVVVQEAVVDARNQGMLVIIATGNDGRAAVAYPAAYPMATAVTALGREGTFAPGSLEEAEVVRPPIGTDPQEFVAGFSNVGTEVTATAPGVGCMSTIFGDRFGIMSGTSMAAPVLTGAVACLLSRDPVIYAMTRDAARSNAIESLMKQNSKVLGFGALFEGQGMPDPAKV